LFQDSTMEQNMEKLWKIRFGVWRE